ncbi:hypothetical protein MLD63_16290 [Paracoccus sp. TK19116]|uniref:Uncharacterized protein n=1 Tax=Paracoccus albicereus TaxID=2922394 RepID=A0ABT1MUG8_9RHOB|nr:hypothetical protein [Paracoccus albicereus]MCQ0971983.1 hypothetical protein [Paracoccus albicereus]
MTLKFNGSLSAAALVAMFVFPSTLPAQTVSVQSNDQRGHGFLFRHLGTCHVVMPKHVANGQRRVRVFSSAPIENSGSVVDAPFWSGLDMAVGTIRGPLEERCTVSLDDLLPGREANEGAVLELLRIRESGEIERLPMVVTKGNYLTFDAETRSSDVNIFKGTSGAFVFDGDQALGMAVEALSETSARFIRTEEIHMNLRRRLGRRVEPVPTGATESGTIEASPDDLDFKVMWTTLPPLYPDQGEENIGGDGSYVFNLSKPNTIALRLDEASVGPVSRILIQTSPDSEFSLPGDITVELSPTDNGTRRLPPRSATMGADGLLDVRLSPTLARWVYITVQSGQDSGSIAIDRVIVR